MPKIKTHKGAKRRFYITGTGKVMHAKGSRSHLRRRKAKRVQRVLSSKLMASPSAQRRVRRLLPYGLP
jgi:large subunit ribosomal protein L35